MPFLKAAIGILLAAATLTAQPRTQRTEQYATALSRLAAMTTLPLVQWRSHADMPHGEDPMLDDSTWTPVTLAAGRGGRGGSPRAGDAWYRTTLEIPRAVGGREVKDGRVKLQVHLSNDGRVFFNGALVAQGDGRTLDPILVADKAVPGQKIVVAVKVPYHAESGRFQGAELLVDHPGQPDPGVVRNEVLAAENVLSGFPSGQAEHLQQLADAVKAIDFAALDRGDQPAFTHSLEAASRGLQPVNDWMKQFTVRVVGNAHIDMAWLWPWTETVEVVKDTFTTALQLMKEYPDFTYAQSSVQDFAWLQEKYPAIFREIQQRVKEGRWELVGGMWVEPDLNMPDGEGLVRQLLVGKRWFKRYFDVDVNIGWNPDSFGYNWQLPQIYKRAGFDTFVTQKMAWNSQESSWRETFTFPYKLFWWQSPDGSRVLTYFPHGYSGGISAASLSQDIAEYVPSTGFPEIMHLYGVGDHGGGPTRQMVDEAVRLKDPSVVFPKIQFSTARAFFDDAEKAIAAGSLKPPVWNNELYLAYHRGCYTTQSETKKLIRQNEELLQNAEKFAALSFLTANRPYSNSDFEEIWKRVLFDHFHDIMPGSGIGVNYADAERNLTDASLRSQKILDGALDSLEWTDRHPWRGHSGGGVQFALLGSDRIGEDRDRRASRGPASGSSRFWRAAATLADYQRIAAKFEPTRRKETGHRRVSCRALQKFSSRSLRHEMPPRYFTSFTIPTRCAAPASPTSARPPNSPSCFARSHLIGCPNRDATFPSSKVSVTMPSNSKFPPGFTLPPLQASSHSRSLPGDRGSVFGGCL